MSDAHGVPPRGAPPGSSDVLALVVGNQTITGWQRVTVSRALGAIPASFSIEATEKYPDLPDIDLEAGQPCTVRIGGDLVLTGYVDRYASSISAGNHTVRVDGRSKSCDLVDCSALVEGVSAGETSSPGMQVVNSDVLSISQKLAKPYNVTVQTNSDGPFPLIPQFNINLGETVWDIIDRITRYSGLLVYDMPDGSVMLATVGTASMASGFALGQNIESADVMFSMDQRFQQYEGHLISMMALGTDAGVNMPGIGAIVWDHDVPRFRKRYVISEQFILGEPLAGKRAQWECNHRFGQSFNFQVTCDAWRDAAGKLWAPNMLAPISAPQLKLANKSWIIATVTYLRDETGQHAQLHLMPPEAFSIEPIAPNVLTTIQDVNNAASAANPTKPNAGFDPPQQTVAT
jgi:prophage tail gpP-like protein